MLLIVVSRRCRWLMLTVHWLYVIHFLGKKHVSHAKLRGLWSKCENQDDVNNVLPMLTYHTWGILFKPLLSETYFPYKAEIRNHWNRIDKDTFWSTELLSICIWCWIFLLLMACRTSSPSSFWMGHCNAFVSLSCNPNCTGVQFSPKLL